MAALSAPHLAHPPSDFIDGRWTPIAGDTLRSHSPASPADVVFACAPQASHVDAAVDAARQALPMWSRTPREQRFAVLRAFADLSKRHAPAMAELICDEVGKAHWECKGEAAILGGKVDITLDDSATGPLSRVTPFDLALSPTRTGTCAFRPHGVMAVIGPFNFPAHLPNGHIVPALAMGNTIVFKPSDKSPAVGQKLVELFDMALRACAVPGDGAGVINLVQGGASISSALCDHPGLDAIAMTGSWAVGRRILEANLDRPGRLIALELGGSNPAIVMGDADLRQAAIEIVRCAFNTSGQRCTCTRRAIIHESVAGRLIPAIAKAASQLIIAPPRTQPCFTGPVVSDASRRAVLSFQARAARAGAQVAVEASAMDAAALRGGFYVSPAIMQVDRFTSAPGDGATGDGATGGLPASAPARQASARADEPPVAQPRVAQPFDPGCDEEVFGPLLRIAVVRSLDEAIEQANATRYGLAASIFTKDPAAMNRFLHEVRAGCLNVNTGTAGASSKLPFGGLGLSGNHRPAGATALDYCAYPVANMVENSGGSTLAEGMRFEEGWVA